MLIAHLGVEEEHIQILKVFFITKGGVRASIRKPSPALNLQRRNLKSGRKNCLP